MISRYCITDYSLFLLLTYIYLCKPDYMHKNKGIRPQVMAELCLEDVGTDLNPIEVVEEGNVIHRKNRC